MSKDEAGEEEVASRGEILLRTAILEEMNIILKENQDAVIRRAKMRIVREAEARAKEEKKKGEHPA